MFKLKFSIANKTKFHFIDNYFLYIFQSITAMIHGSYNIKLILENE